MKSVLSLKEEKMGLGVKSIQAFLLRFLEISVTSSWVLMRKKPLVSGVLLSFFLLYIFLPTFFTFLIVAGPILVFMAVAFGIIFSIHRHNLRVAKGEKIKPSIVKEDPILNKRENFASVRPQSVRRRNAKEVYKQASLQEGEVEKDMIFSTFPNDALVDKAPLVEENAKEIREVKVDPVKDCAESSSSPVSQYLMPQFRKVSEERATESTLGNEDEEETQEHNQKNAMDFGILEGERNKRLESLIARRRARKLLSMQVRRTLMNLGNNDPSQQIASILIPRNSHFNSNSSSEMVSPTPGSAPSVLLPVHNPFDLPYDPHEEKPNLSGGSFQEEFMESEQQDLTLSRHESFNLRPLFPGRGELSQRQRETFPFNNFDARSSKPEAHEFSRLKNQSGKEEETQVITTEPFQEEKPKLPTSPRDHEKNQDQASEEVVNLVNTHHQDDQTKDKAPEEVVNSVDIYHKNNKTEDQASEEVVNSVDIHHKADKTEDQASKGVVNSVDIPHEGNKPEEVPEEPNFEADVSDGSRSSSSSDLNVPFSSANRDIVLKSLSFSFRANFDRENNIQQEEISYEKSTAPFENQRPEECVSHAEKSVNHAPRDSIASDLQVEVSECSSPVKALDEISSHSDKESEVDKETHSGSEEKCATSFNLIRKEVHESKWKEVHEVREQHVVEDKFSRSNKKSQENHIELSMMEERVVEEDTGPGVSFLRTESERNQTPLVDFKDEDHYEEHSSQEANRIYDVNDQEVLESDEKEILEMIKDTSNEAEAVEISEWSPDPSRHSEGEFEDEMEQRVILEGSNLNGNVLGASVAVQGPSNSSSPSSTTSVFEESVQRNQGPLLSVDQIKEADCVERVDNSFLDKVLAECSSPMGTHFAMDFTNETRHLFHDREPETPREPKSTPKNRSMEELNMEAEEIPVATISCSTPKLGAEKLDLLLDSTVVSSGNMVLKEQNPSYNMKDLGFPANDDGENLKTIDDISSNDNENFKINEDFRGQSMKQAEFKNTAEASDQVGNEDATESIQEHEGGPPVVVQSLLPEVAAEQAPNSIFSPTSVLQKELYTDRLNLDRETQVEASESSEGNNLLNGLPAEILKETAAQDDLHSNGDKNAHLSSPIDSETTQEPISSIGKSIEVTVNCNSEPIDDSEGKTKPLVKHEVSGGRERIEEGGDSVLTNSKHGLESTEVDEGGTKMLSVNDVGPLKPEEQYDDLNILVSSDENKEPSKADLGKSFEETELFSDTETVDASKQLENADVADTNSTQKDEGDQS